MALKCLIVLSIVCCLTNSELVNTNDTKEHSNLRKRDVNSYVGLVACAMKYDLPCFIDVAQDYLENRRTDLLAQADAQILQSGRSDPDNKPSHLADTLTKLISEITAMFQNGFSGLFDAGREALDDDDSELEKNGTEMTTNSDSNGETRTLNKSGGKKKKKKPLKNLIRLIKVAIVAIIIVIKLSVVLKVLQTAMQFKFMLISLGGFAIQAVKLWMSVRNKKDMHGHEEIVYRNPYGGDAEYSSPPGGAAAAYGAGDYNARSGQDMAYAAQRGMIM